MPFFSQQRVWHSFLKSRSPVVMRFKNPPLMSKYKDNDGNDQWLIYFTVRGDEPGEDYYYNIEDAEILDKLRNVDYSKWYSVTAGGGLDAKQTLEIVEASDQSAGAPRQVSSGGGASHGGDSFSTGYIVDDYRRCVEEAGVIAASAPLDTTDATVIQSIAATLYINWSRTNFRVPLSASARLESPDDVLDTSPAYELIEKLTKRSGKAHDGKALKTAIDKIESALDTEVMMEPDVYQRMVDWLTKEVEHQTPEELTDDLPF